MDVLQVGTEKKNIKDSENVEINIKEEVLQDNSEEHEVKEEILHAVAIKMDDNTNDIKPEIEEFTITKEMLDEENTCAEENDLQKKAELDELKERAREEKEIADKRHKTLMHLLSKSEFYSKYLLTKISTQQEELENKRTKRAKKSTKTVNKENSQDSESTSEDASQSSNEQNQKKRKPLANKNQVRKKKKLNNYEISEILGKEDIEDAMAGDQESEDIINRLEQPKLFENGTMRNYQLDGYSWLKVLYENGINGILADEMGLGKTIQCIAVVAYLIEMEVPGPFLVVGPLSTLPNWMSEFNRFTPKIPLVLYHGPEEDRKIKRRVISKKVTIEGISKPKFPVVITSYDILIRDSKILSRYGWKYLVVDEGHRLKNSECRLFKCLKTFNPTNRLILTGTPLQNNLSELWSLMNFLLPEIFDSLEVFQSWFNISDMMDDGSDEKIIQQEREQQVLGTLHKILNPFLLRRTKADVAIDIPPKKELLVYTPMTQLQLKLYTATIGRDYATLSNKEKEAEEKVEYNENGRRKRTAKKEQNFSSLLEETENPKTFDAYIDAAIKVSKDRDEQFKLKGKKGTTMAINIKMQNLMMQMRRIVNHPYLLQYPLDKEGNIIVDEDLVKNCGKLQVLDQLLCELKARGHKVLLFSQMTMLLNIIEDYLFLRPQYAYKRLDGSTSLDDRRKDIYEFNNDPNCFLYLLSTRAGSLGINLTAADTAIIYDSDWNPQQDLQAQDRCHRIGQTKPVLVLRLITSATVDERIVQRAAAKRKLEKIVMKSGTFTSSSVAERNTDKVFDLDELRDMLKQTDYERIHRTETGNIFTKKELDYLLDRSDMLQDTENNNVKTDLCGVFKTVVKEES